MEPSISLMNYARKKVYLAVYSVTNGPPMYTMSYSRDVLWYGEHHALAFITAWLSDCSGFGLERKMAMSKKRLNKSDRFNSDRDVVGDSPTTCRSEFGGPCKALFEVVSEPIPKSS